MSESRYQLAKKLLPKAEDLRDRVIAGDTSEATFAEYQSLARAWGYEYSETIEDIFQDEVDGLHMELRDYVREEEAEQALSRSFERRQRGS